MDHIFCNAHGEWQFIGAMLTMLPVGGVWLRGWLCGRKACGGRPGHHHAAAR